MASFEVSGLVGGRLAHRQIQAGSRDEAIMLARQEGLQVLAVRGGASPALFRRRARFELTLFAHELRALLAAGLSLIEAVETLADHQQGQAGHGVYEGLSRAMYEGLSFSRALEKFPETFPPLFVATIAASEQTGEMAAALERYLRYQEQLNLVRDKVVSAALYPALLLLVGSAVGLFLLCYLVPRFSHIYEGMDAQLPLASRLLMRWGELASEHTLAVSLGGAGLVGAIILLFQQPETRAMFGRWLQSNRWIGPQMRLMQLSRFYRSIGLLLRGGIPLLKGLEMTKALLPVNMQPQVARVMRRVNEGSVFSTSLAEADLATAVALRLLRAGERNGQVADMLEQVASFHDHEVGRWIDAFTRLFEPLLMLFIGGVIGGIVILLYLPIFELASSLQ